MSFLRPHKIKITRPQGNTAKGVQGYGGLDPDDETLIADDVDANIYYSRTSRQLPTGIPGDGVQRPMSRVVFSLPNGTVRLRDIITEKTTEQRFQVTEPYWSSFGYSCLVETLAT